MFDLPILDVAMGLALVYFLLSLIASTVNEGVATLLGLRAETLGKGLQQLLGDGLATGVSEHHLVAGLTAQVMWKHRKKPTYIPTATFVTALLDTLGLRNDPPGYPMAAADVRAAIEKIEGQAKLKQALLALFDAADEDVEKFKKSLGAWFDQAMERVSAWYRMRVQTIIRVLAVGVVLWLGVDSVEIAKRLWIDPSLRSALAAEATKIVQQRGEPSSGPAAASTAGTPTAAPASAGSSALPTSDSAPSPASDPAALPTSDSSASPAGDPSASASGGSTGSPDRLSQLQSNLSDAVDQLGDLELPLSPFRADRERHLWQARHPTPGPEPALPGLLRLFFAWLFSHLVGFLITTAAISMGAPFWFDLLSKLVDLRSSGKKPVPAAQPPASPPVAGQPA